VRDARASAEASGDRWLAIQADCVLAAVLAVRGRAEESLALYARAMPPVEADPTADPTTAQVCFSQRSVTLRNLGQSEAAARDAESGLKALDLQPGAHRVNRIFLRLNVADAMTKSGDVAGAVKLYEDAVVEM